MSERLDISDLGQRVTALDPGRSFIVQAPAGSGKTELLIQRYLVLLSRVEQPEEIAAITFTKKSTAEMRKRILEALAQARGGERPAEPHRALTWDHARAALARDSARGWRLEENAARLRVQTIDALCASLTRQMPVLASFGAQPEMVEDASALYREASEATLGLLEGREAESGDVARLLEHLDNNVSVAAGLLVSMLARRDQWLRAVKRGLDRVHMEAGLAAERSSAVERLRASFGEAAAGGVESWQAFADELLTQKGEWRKRNARAQAFAARPDGEALREELHTLRRLPPAAYSDAQWEVLGAMARLLPIAVAQLKLVFAAHGRADFPEIAQGALLALGETDEPTDLLLSLDYRIRHVLVDEFQDTSYTQYDLLQRLTAGWEPGDGRTLFLVGDPMQSIYRFREADVSLFLRARREGLGTVPLEPLALSANFRSQANIVEWVNSSFARVLPPAEDLSAGAVAYAPSAAVHPAAPGGVTVHCFFNDDEQAEAERVAAVVAGAQAEDPQGSIAVLVRNRAHLEAVVPQMKKAGLRIRAIEIEDLGHRQVVQDLLALTRALAHPADRTAWLAVLRAPWCGMTLADLHVLAAPSPQAPARSREPADILEDLFPQTLEGSASPPHSYIRSDTRTVWEQMHDEARLARLGADGRARLERAREVLGRAQGGRLRGALRDRVEAAWLSLSGPACVADDTDLEDAERYLDYLEQCEQAGEIADFDALEQGMAKLYALPDLHAGPGDAQLLTIHKAKGLEFDTVIIPGLGSAPRRPDPSLLLWTERASRPPYLLLAPIKQTGAERDAIYDYLARLEAEKESHEDARLLYVAATRARMRVHLLGDTRCEEKHGVLQLKPPTRGTLLEKLWAVVEPQFAEQLRRAPAPRSHEDAAQPAIDQRLRRLPSDWQLPALPAGLQWSAPPEPARRQDEIEFSWAGETARHVGSVVHRWLQRIAEDGLQGWSRTRVRALSECVGRELAALGVGQEQLSAATGRVLAALANSIEDERGRWLLGPHRDARSELRLSAMIDGQAVTLVIDRVFAGDDGLRWIVDYKTSSHEGAGREGFLDRERERYTPQLERYARVLGEKGAALGLYFPLLTAWREWKSGS